MFCIINLESYANALSTLSDKLNLIKGSLEGVATTVDNEAGRFSTSLNARKADIESITNKLSDLLNEFKTQTEVLGIRAIAEETQHIRGVCEKMNVKLSELEIRQQNITAVITRSVESLKDKLKEHTDNAEQNIRNVISSTDKKQIWIGLIIIVLVCVDIILHFIKFI